MYDVSYTSLDDGQRKTIGRGSEYAARSMWRQTRVDSDTSHVIMAILIGRGSEYAARSMCSSGVSYKRMSDVSYKSQKLSDVSYTSLDDGHNTLHRGCLHHRAWLGVRCTVYVPPDGVDSDISHATMVTPAGTAGHTDRAA